MLRSSLLAAAAMASAALAPFAAAPAPAFREVKYPKKTRPKHQPAGTKLVRMAAEGRLGMRWNKGYRAGRAAKELVDRMIEAERSEFFARSERHHDEQMRRKLGLA